MSLLNQLPWLEQKKIAAWQRCRERPSFPPEDWRIDDFGTAIRRSDYGIQGDHGWEVDHIIPTALGGLDPLDNVRALHCRSNRQLGAMVGNALNPPGLLGRGNALSRLMTGGRK